MLVPVVLRAHPLGALGVTVLALGVAACGDPNIDAIIAKSEVGPSGGSTGIGGSAAGETLEPIGGMSSSTGGATGGFGALGGATSTGGWAGGVGSGSGSGGNVALRECPPPSVLPTGVCSNLIIEPCPFMVGDTFYECECVPGDTGLVWACFDPETNCPATPPGWHTDCFRMPIGVCLYPNGQECDCDRGTWDCTLSSGSDGDEEGSCPSPSEIVDNGSCDSPDLECPYDGQDCTCIGGAWDCEQSCPVDPPIAGDGCLVPLDAEPCGYPDANATCSCIDGTWECLECPVDTSQPTTGQSCNPPESSSILNCSYATSTCACTNGFWFCCPEPAPTAGDSCSLPSQICWYDDGAARCTCETDLDAGASQWACVDSTEEPHDTTTATVTVTSL